MPDETAPPEALASLVARFDPDVIEIPSGSARIRLGFEGEPEWDAVITTHGADLFPAGDDPCDAELIADFSMNAVRRLSLAEGKTMSVELPPERLLVFPRDAR